MPRKKDQTTEVIEKILDYTLEELMGERFGSYSKYIIQERAIPDARDGLKPVQRRILYSMYKEKNTYNNKYRKSAKTVGDVIGNYHPHGDTSIYDAMVRMSQDWKTSLPYIDMHGNNGSIDGDSPAAYRYTEARLSKISNEMLKDIDRDSVEFAPNFDDTTKEPTVLPARFPALLVYGSQGIAAGYATNMAPHNLNEVVDGAIYRIDNPNCTLEELMNIIKGPDFPTGAILEGKQGLIDAYKTGKGKVIIRAKTSFITEKKLNQIIITEIPYETNKAGIVKKIDEIKLDKKIEGILEVTDESTKDIRIVIDLKPTASKEVILNYLFKNTDLQVSYNFNNVAIANKRPKLLSLPKALDYFLEHQKNVILKRTKFDLAHAKKRFEIVEGLIKCLSILDEVIKVIRVSKNRSDAKENLIKEFNFTPLQSEAIITLQLYKLTNTDVLALEEEKEKLLQTIDALNSILQNENILKKVMKKELKDINKEYITPRKTEIKEEITEIKIDLKEMIPEEDTIVLTTKDGYIKRTSPRSFNSSNLEDLNIKENDYILSLYNMTTLNTLLLFTSLGNYLHIPVHLIPDLKWKDMPKHVSNIIPLSENEEIISTIPVYNFNEKINIIIATKNGNIKKTELKEFEVQRYNKPTQCIKLKENDLLINAILDTKPNIFTITNEGVGLTYQTEEIPITKIKTAGVKSIKLKEDYVVSLNNYSHQTDEFITIITENGTGKRIRLSEFSLSTRARRGLQIIREVKNNPYKIINTFILPNKNSIGIKNSTIKEIKLTELPITDRYSTGTNISKSKIKEAFEIKSLETSKIYEKYENNNKQEVKKINLDEIDDRLMTIDDFLN